MKRFVKMIAVCMVMTLFAALLSTPAQALNISMQKDIVSTGAVGEGIGKQTTVVDFTASDLCGFEVLGSIASPTFNTSGAWGTPVLYTWVDSAQPQTGIRGTLATTAKLAGADTLSVQLLAQYTKTANYTVTLRLEGIDKNGFPLSLEASTLASSASWQTVTFDISAFVESANTDAPCTVTVLTSCDTDAEQFVLWVRSLYTSTLEIYPDIVLPAAAASCGLIFGFAFFFVIYRATCKKNRHHRMEAR